MGRREAESRKRARKANLKKIILTTVATAGLLSVAVLAPSALTYMAKIGLIPTKRQRETVNSSRRRLVEQGFLQYKNKHLSLTPKGEAELWRLAATDSSSQKPKRWDGKWRVLVFDIPERRRGMRDKVRRTLVAVGFVRLQDSVWIYPYDCEDLITLLKADFKIGKDLLYMIVDSLENDVPYRHMFGITLH